MRCNINAHGGSRVIRALAIVMLVWLGSRSAALAQETVQISVPPSVSFTVVNVGASTTATPSVTSLTFSNRLLLPLHALRISVRAEGNLTPPSGPSIQASNVSWTTSNVSGGAATNGALSATAYNQVFESTLLALSGGCDLAWTLAAPGAPLRAGTHQVTLRWKLESIIP